MVLGAVIATAVVTAWAMSETGLAGPLMSWERAEEAVDQVWSSTPVSQAPPAPTAMMPTAAQPPNAARMVAGLPGVPPIVSGAASVHADRGACTTCHAVSTPQGGPIPSIRSFSMMPHEFRGVCGNCHQVTSGPGPVGSAVAGTVAVPQGLGAPVPQASPPPNEAEWNGLEVSGAAQGVVVAATEGASAQTGLQRGDVVLSVNGLKVPTVADFAQVTQNGMLPQGAMIVARNGQRLAVELGTPAATGMGAAGLPAAGMTQAPSTMPQTNQACPPQMGRF